jgi:leucyl/phenylalanyl-tRNA--protein transferase
LEPERLLAAYSQGIFPMYDEGEPICWWSPDPRAIFEFDQFRASRRLLRTCRGGRFEVTCNRDFAGVIRGCATAGDRLHNTWLTESMIQAYSRLHALGYAHSVEVWRDAELAGGTYGVALGGLYSGEPADFPCSTSNSARRTPKVWAPSKSREPATCAGWLMHCDRM